MNAGYEELNRHEFETAVYASGLDSASKQILAYYAYKKHWNNDGLVWPSNPTTARETGISLPVVNRRVPKLRESGWLIDTGKRVGNGAIVYALAIGTPITQIVVDTSPTDANDRTPITQIGHPYQSDSGTPITVIDKEVRQQVKEEVKTTTVPDGPVVDTTPSNLEKEVPPALSGPVTPTVPLTTETGKVRAYKPKELKEPSMDELEEFGTVHRKLTKQEREELEKERLEPAW